MNAASVDFVVSLDRANLRVRNIVSDLIQRRAHASSDAGRAEAERAAKLLAKKGLDAGVSGAQSDPADVVLAAWVVDSCVAENLQPLAHEYVVLACDATRADLRLEGDVFGDRYFEEATVESLRRALREVSALLPPSALPWNTYQDAVAPSAACPQTLSSPPLGPQAGAASHGAKRALDVAASRSVRLSPPPPPTTSSAVLTLPAAAAAASALKCRPLLTPPLPPRSQTPPNSGPGLKRSKPLTDWRHAAAALTLEEQVGG
jgi:hypothetical protein